MKRSYYAKGQWNVVCDRCGAYKKFSEVVMQMIPEFPNILVCKDKCLDKHNPQFDLRGVPDNPTAPVVRDNTTTNTTLNSSANGYADGYTAPLTASNLSSNGVI